MRYLIFSIYISQKTTKQFGMKISPLKYKVMIFQRKVPIRSKIVIGNNILKQANTFMYLGCKIHRKREKT
jgi:hypothetical protein